MRPTDHQQTNGFAVASMILGIVWLLWIGSYLAVIFGQIALRQINKSGGQQTGKAMAITGLAFGYAGVITSLFVLPWVLSSFGD